MNTYSIEVIERGITRKFVTTLAANALAACNKIATLYQVGPYQFIARRVTNE